MTKKILSSLVLCLALVSCGEELDYVNTPQTPVLSAKASVAILDSPETEERLDISAFMCVDSLRGRILHMAGSTKQQLRYLDTFDGTSKPLFDLTAMATGFEGAVEYIKVLSDGNYLLYEARDGGLDRLWKLWPEEGRMENVFTFRNTYQYLRYNWGLEYDSDHGILYLSEYGNSLDYQPNSSQTALGYKADANRIWMSKDNARTWSVFYDFRSREDLQTEYFHIHGLGYDSHKRRLYVTSGDGWVDANHCNKRLWWFEEDSETPLFREMRYYWGQTNDAFSHAQIVSFYVAEDFIVAGGDDYQNCLYRIDKDCLSDSLKLEIVYQYDSSVSSLITQYTSRFKRLSNGMIVTMLVNGDTGALPRQMRLVGTYDGYQWIELFHGYQETSETNFWSSGLFDEWKGYLYFNVKDIDAEGRKITRFIKMKTPENV